MDLNDHFFLNSSNDIARVCQPLKKIGVDVFIYQKWYQDGSHLHLSNLSEWSCDYYQSRLFDNEQQFIKTLSGVISFVNLKRSPVFQKLEVDYGVTEGLMIVVKNPKSTETFFYGAAQSAQDFVGNEVLNLALLRRFRFYFKDKASDIIVDAKSYRFFPEVQFDSSVQETEAKQRIGQFLAATKVKKFCVNVSGVDCYFPRREAEIIALMRSGYTSKEMARKLNLSYRTVEYYRENLKKRLSHLIPEPPVKTIMGMNELTYQIVFDN